MAMGDKSAEIRAGIVVLIALVILGAGLFIVSGGWERFEDKEFYTIHFPNAGGLGGIAFAGFTDIGKFISSVTVSGPGDIVAVDDVRYVSGVIPEPTSLIIWSLLGALGITIGWWRRRRAA